MVTAEPGDTIDVQYEAVNTGDVDSTQTLELTLDGTSVVVGTEQTFAVGSTGTGTLTWNIPTDQSIATYQLCVEGENSTDCTDLIIEQPIPDSQGYVYNEGDYESFWIGAISDNAGSRSKEIDHLFVQGGGDTTGGAIWSYVSDEKVDLTPYSTLEIDWLGSTPDAAFGTATVFFSSNLAVRSTDISSTDQKSVRETTFTRTTDTLDVSTFGGGASGDGFYFYIEAADLSSTASNQANVELYSLRLIE